MHLKQLQKARDHEKHSEEKLTRMGLIWSITERGKIHNSSELNEERGELTQGDSDSNPEEIFYETVDNVSSSNGDLAQNIQKLAETENSLTKESYETSTTAGEVNLISLYHQQKEKISESAVYETSSTLSNFNTEALKDCLIATEECQEKDSKTTKWPWTNVSCRDLPLLEEEDQVVECSNFSLPLISEEKVFREKHFKSTSDPQMFVSVDSSQQLKPEIPRSCSWQVDVDCFKSKKRKKPPKKYQRAKEQDLQYDDVNKRSATRDKQELFTESYLASSKIATQEMMARRKVLDLRRW